MRQPNGAGSRGRTDTVLLPSDFESDASANSTIPACVEHECYYSIVFLKNQYKFIKSIKFLKQVIVFLEIV